MRVIKYAGPNTRFPEKWDLTAWRFKPQAMVSAEAVAAAEATRDAAEKLLLAQQDAGAPASEAAADGKAPNDGSKTAGKGAEGKGAKRRGGGKGHQQQHKDAAAAAAGSKDNEKVTPPAAAAQEQEQAGEGRRSGSGSSSGKDATRAAAVAAVVGASAGAGSGGKAESGVCVEVVVDAVGESAKVKLTVKAAGV